MLKDLFVPYEIAVILKNLGFKEDCLTFWHTTNGETLLRMDYRFSGYRNSENDNTTAPLYQQALDFLRTEYKIEITVLESYETPGTFESTIYSELILEEEDFGTDHTDYYSCLNEAIMESFNIIQKSKEVAL
jgi:hypothetical protein